METPNVTLLLRRLESGDETAAEELFSVLYGELRHQAGRLMVSAPENHTLQPTALVNEAWLRLVPNTGGWEGRSHFLGVAAKAMRSVLVDHARGKGRRKRGSEHDRVGLDAAVAAYEDKNYDLIALDEALEKFSQIDSELTRLVELRFFGGLTIPETAKVLEMSTATVERHWRIARTWLRGELGSEM